MIRVTGQKGGYPYAYASFSQALDCVHKTAGGTTAVAGPNSVSALANHRPCSLSGQIRPTPAAIAEAGNGHLAELTVFRGVNR
jgi:hypothetical protein